MKTACTLSVFFALLPVWAAGQTTGQMEKQGGANTGDTATKTDNTIITSLPSASFERLVQAMGFECTRGKDASGKEDSYFTFRAQGYKVAGFTEETYIELYNAFTDVNPTLATVNEWNQTHNITRAYVDKDGSAVLESDLIISGGVTRADVEEFIKTYRDMVAQWARFVIDRKK
jgi:hypothetical protein